MTDTDEVALGMFVSGRVRKMHRVARSFAGKDDTISVVLHGSLVRGRRSKKGDLCIFLVGDGVVEEIVTSLLAAMPPFQRVRVQQAAVAARAALPKNQS